MKNLDSGARLHPDKGGTDDAMPPGFISGLSVVETGDRSGWNHHQWTNFGLDIGTKPRTKENPKDSFGPVGPLVEFLQYS